MARNTTDFQRKEKRDARGYSKRVVGIAGLNVIELAEQDRVHETKIPRKGARFE